MNMINMEALIKMTTQIPRDQAEDLIKAMKEASAHVDTNDTSQERVDKTSESVHEAQRTWVGLTDEEIKQMGLSNYIKVVRETEAKLKEKNT